MADLPTIYVLGGGMSGLTAAVELTRYPGWKDKYHVVVVEAGTRLGGKMSTWREDSPPYRIHEHGVHILQGWYCNTFRMMDEVYRKLHEAPGAPAPPFPTWLDALDRMDGTLLYQEVTLGGSKIRDYWTLSLPSTCENPAQAPPDLFRRMARLLEIAWDLWMGLKRSGNGVGPAHGVGHDQYVRDLIATLGEGPGLAVMNVVTDGLLGDGAAVRLLGDVLDADVSALQAHLVSLYGTVTPTGSEPPYEVDDQTAYVLRVYHAFICLDLARAMLRGLTTPQEVVPGTFHTVWDFASCTFDLEPINRLDFRYWLKANGAHDLTRASALVDFLYKGTFSNHVPLAAGTGVRFLLATAGYRGSFVWQFKLGTGDTMIMPLYQRLKDLGVEFRMNRQVRKLEWNDRGVVQKIVVAKPPTETKPEDATFEVPGDPAFQAWRDRPAYAGNDAETWALEPEDHVILAIPFAAIDELAPGSQAADLQVGDAAGIRTTMTVSAQLWLSRSLADLGLPDQVLCDLRGSPASVVVDEAVMTSWTENTSVLHSERWPPAVPAASAVIFSGAFEDTGTLPDEEWVRAEVESKTLDHMVEHFWPDFDPDQVIDTAGHPDPNLNAQFFTAATAPTDRFTLSPPWPTEKTPRVTTDGAPLPNLVIAGDWIDFGMNAGYTEGAVIAGLQAAQALRVRLGLGGHQPIWSDMDLGPWFPCVCGPGCRCGGSR